MNFENMEQQVEEMLSEKYDEIGDFIDGLAVVVLDGKYGFIDSSGKEITPLKYDGRMDFQRVMQG